MHIFMFIVSVLVFLVAVLTMMAAKSSIHEIYAAVLGLISSIFWIGAAIVEAINKNGKDLIQQQRKQSYTPPAEGTKTKLCTYCDAEISVSAAVCPKCGKVLGGDERYT